MRPGDLVSFKCPPLGLYLWYDKHSSRFSRVITSDEAVIGMVVSLDQHCSRDTLLVVGLHLGWVSSTFLDTIDVRPHHAR